MTETSEFIDTYKRFLDRVVRDYAPDDSAASALTQRVSDHICQDVRGLPVVKESISPPRLVDADLAIAAIAGDDHTVIGLAGGHDVPEASLSMLLRGAAGRVDVGPVDYINLPTGPGTERQV
ncbi:MAG: hypothetical protein L0K86_24750, partial [Actinomycetia bacterium]|nr:hypothetical protein [Actinomycetes bacterium]